MYRFLIALFLLTNLSIFAQTKEIITKDRYNFLVDSLTTLKSDLLAEKVKLNNQIDSLKNILEKLKDDNTSTRVKELIKKYGKENGSRIAKGQIWKGMTEKMLEESWGKPDKINKNKEKWGTFTQWYYGDITYFFKNGIMIGWEEKKN